MKKVAESLFEYKEGIGYIERLDEGWKDRFAKALSILALTTALSLNSKQVKSMNSDELKSKVENVIDNKAEKQKVIVSSKGKSLEEAQQNLINDIKSKLEKEGLVLIKTSRLAEPKTNASGEWAAAAEIIVTKKIVKDKTTEDSNDKKQVTIKKSSDDSVFQKKKNNIVNQLRQKGFKYSGESDKDGNLIITYWK